MTSIVLIGAGPAGLIAAEHLAGLGHSVTVFDRMASPARKFLFAGRGGLNLTHSEPHEAFLARYGAAAGRLAPLLAAFPAEALRSWAEGLGEPTFIGSSGRVFPKSFKATPLLRAWLRRLDRLGVSFRFGMRWTGWDETGALIFETDAGRQKVHADAVLLALGGASWPRLGSDGGWVPLLAARGIAVTPLAASNVGVRIDWRAPFIERFHGAPLKGCAFRLGDGTSRAEAVITRDGMEGGAVYALSAPLRAALAKGSAELAIDLKPDLSEAALSQRLARARTSETLSNILRKNASLPLIAIGLLREATGGPLPREATSLARRIKDVRLPVAGPGGLARSISTAGGIAWEAVDEAQMLTALPGTFVAGEMLDVDAPTGGYLLQAAFSTGMAAARGMAAWLQRA
ncbi:MAG TPA: TIGR03862 family flavoprotein [Beijerinckiaceae bacterium]|nr:TIGR03862 family flavoprotein [Beijerinckiaceae bacterium]